MRWPNDLMLAEKVDEIDLVLGGHDHDYGIQEVNGTTVLKSGSDFRNLSQLTLKFCDSKVEIDIKEMTIDSTIREDEEMKKVVQQYVGKFFFFLVRNICLFTYRNL